MVKAVIAIAFLATLSACSNCKQCVKLDIKLPERPALQVIHADDLACLTDDAYMRLLEREQARRAYAEDLEVIAKECVL